MSQWEQTTLVEVDEVTRSTLSDKISITTQSFLSLEYPHTDPMATFPHQMEANGQSFRRYTHSLNNKPTAHLNACLR